MSRESIRNFKFKTKPTLEQVKNLYLSVRCELLEDVYVGNKIKMKYKCSCGFISCCSLIDFRKSDSCYVCANKKRWANLEYNKKLRKSLSIGLKLKFQDKDYTDKLYATRKTKCYRDNMKEVTKQKWQDEDYIKKVKEGYVKSLKIHPNKPEKILDELLKQSFPNEYKFVGNKKVFFDKFNPDFINCNGQKKIIELYGDYWHSKSQVKDAKRLTTYNKYGYDTLVIWENELENLDKVKSRLIEFHNGVHL